MLRQGKMKHNKEQFEYPKSIVIPRCEGGSISYYRWLSIKITQELKSELDVVRLTTNWKISAHTIILLEVRTYQIN